MGLHNVFHLEYRVTTMKTNGFGFRGERHNTAIVARQDHQGLVAQTSMEYTLYRTKKTVAIYQGIHGLNGACG